MMAKRARVAFIGWGAINSRVGALLAQRRTDVEIVGVATLDTPEARAAIPNGIAFLGDPSDLAALKPDLVVEAAGRSAIDRWAPAAIAVKATLVIASTSAFCDDALLPHLSSLAQRHGTRIIITPGAIGGIDALAGAAVLGLDSVMHRIVKPPVAWKGTPAEKLLDLDALSERVCFFTGTARDAATQYPQNANATVVTSLAGLGIDRTRVELVADPAVRINQHNIVAQGPSGRMEIVLENSPLATNPKSSELTALSLVRLIENATGSVVI